MGQAAVAAFRPEDARVLAGTGSPNADAAVLEGIVAARMMAGSSVTLHVDLPLAIELRLVCEKDVIHDVGDQVRVVVPTKAVLFY